TTDSTKVKKIACTEYKAAWLYDDGITRFFYYKNNNVSFLPYRIPNKIVDVSTGFNRITFLDDKGYAWIDKADSATRWEVDASGNTFNNVSSIYGYFYSYLFLKAD